jgi:small basic protein
MNNEYDYSVGILGTEEILEEREKIFAFLDDACSSIDNPIMVMTPQSLFDAACEGKIFILGFYVKTNLAGILVYEFIESNVAKFVCILVVAGEKIFSMFKRMFYELILEWFKELGAEFVQIAANDRLAKIYEAKFNYNKAFNILYTKL